VKRREFLKLSAMAAAATAHSAHRVEAQEAVEKPNVIILIADQVHYGMNKAAGYPLDVMPTMDGLQQRGVGFERNYCTSPLCVPSRISMLTGRWPEAHRVRINTQPDDAYFQEDVYQVAKKQGYATGLTGKNHSYLKKEKVDFWREYSHGGGYISPDAPKEVEEYDKWLRNLHFNVSLEPTPFPLSTQLPYRIVSDAIEFVDAHKDKPFLLQVSFPEPHNPEQVPAPYWNMFPPEAVPPRVAGPEALAEMGERAQWQFRNQQQSFDTETQWRRYKSNYLGSLRMVDDQIGRLMKHLEQQNLSKRTVIVFTTDHGDFDMDYGLARKGVGLYEDLTHTSMIWSGYGVRSSPPNVSKAFTSMADLMPTICEAIGAAIPHGVQGRSLWPLLKGEPFPAEEFRSICSSVGVGGLYYEDDDHVPISAGQMTGAMAGGFDELNLVTMSGNQKMVRMGDWKLVYDMMGYGRLHDLRSDPKELRNLFGKPQFAKEQAALMAELAMWVIRNQDSLPTGPQDAKYQTKWSKQHNWYAPYRHVTAPGAFNP
jgi:arylsulfatase A-like enzyme